MSLTFNKFKSTTIYGNFNNSDYPDNSVIANGQFDRDLTIKGDIYIGTETSTTDTSGNIIYTDTNGLIRFYLNGVLYTITPSQLTQLNNNLASQSWVNTLINQKISDLIGGSGSNLDTLKEIADAINNDTQIYNTLLNNIATKGGLSNNNIWTGTQEFNNDITFNNNINGISPAIFSYISGLTSSAQQQINNLNNNFNNYQPLLLYDTIPTLNSNKMLTSGAVFDALSNYEVNLTFDTVPTVNSQNLINSGNLYNMFLNYQLVSDMSNYQLVSNMSNYQLVSNMSNYQLVSNMSNYQLVSDMSNYQLISGMSNYPTLSGNNTFSGNNIFSGITCNSINNINSTTLNHISGLTSSAQTQINTVNTSLNTANNNISTLQTQMTTANNNISTLQSQITTTNTNISTLQGQMTTTNNNISTLQTQMTTANNNISTLQTQMNTANTNISTLQGQMTTANNNITTINSTLNTKANSSAPLISSYLYLNNINGVFPITSGAFMALGSNLTGGNAEGNFINTATFLQSSSLMAFNFSKLLTTTTKRDLLQIFNTGNASLLGVLTVNDINTNGNNPITSLNTTLANMTLTDNQMMLQISNNINSINSLNTSVNTLNTNVSNINNTLNTKADIYGYTGCYILDGDISTKGFNKHPVFSSEARFGSFMANSADAIILMPGYQVILYTGINYTGTSQTFTNPNFTSNPAPAFVNLSGTSIGVNALSSIKVFRWSVAVGNYVEITMTGLS